MSEQFLTEEEVKTEVEEYMAKTYGTMFEDEITVYRITPADAFRSSDFIFMQSKNLPGNTITLKRGKTADDIECDYMQVFYREKFVKPILEGIFDNTLDEYLLLVDKKERTQPINFELTIDQFMLETGVCFNLMVKEADFNQRGAEFYEEVIHTLIDEYKEKNWRFPYITVWVCKDLPDGKVTNMQQFDTKWDKADKCKKLKHMTVYTQKDFSVETKPWV